MTARFGPSGIAAADLRAPRTWWLWPWGCGRPSVAEVPGFLSGRDVLHIDLDPRRFRGPILLRTRPSDNRRDGLVTVNGATLVVVPGVPNLSDRDLRVNVRGIPAAAVRSAMIVDRTGGGWGQDRPVSRVQDRGWAA
jgi:hypothetical protein